jgi:8-oxo-dGTP diphosphatase
MSPVPEKMFVTSDAVAVCWSEEQGLQVLLVERANEPYKGCWALPGGFVDLGEDLGDACARELQEETGVRAAAMAQIGAWGKPGRDPRGRNISVAYLAVVRAGEQTAHGADDASRAAWHRAYALPPLAFDHADMVTRGLEALRSLAVTTRIALAFLGHQFGLKDLCGVLAAVSGRAVTRRGGLAYARRAGLVTGLATEALECADECYLRRLDAL